MVFLTPKRKKRRRRSRLFFLNDFFSFPLPFPAKTLLFSVDRQKRRKRREQSRSFGDDSPRDEIGSIAGWPEFFQLDETNNNIYLDPNVCQATKIVKN